MTYLIYILAGLSIGWIVKRLLKWLARKFPIREHKCQCEYHRKRRKLV